MSKKPFFRVIQYYDYSILVDGKEYIISGGNPTFEVCDEIYGVIDEQLVHIQKKLSSKILSDVAMVVIYDVAIEPDFLVVLNEIAKESYSKYKKVALNVFKDSLLESGKVVIVGTHPIVLSSNINHRNIKN